VYGLNVRLKGAIAEGRAPAVIKVMTETVLEEIADYAHFEVLMGLDATLQHPTGYYESNVTKEPRGPGVISVNDSGVIYGPWLEGTSSRNQSTSFKGYANFRRARNRVGQKAGAIAAATIQRQMGALG
jgi:hypothetical protein